MKIPSILYTILAALVTVMIPLILFVTAIRLLLTPLFPQVEYHMPGFPVDSYGFTLQDRLKWSDVAIDYLVNNAGISFLGDLQFPDGSSLYNERELKHMVDVKNLVQFALRLWMILAAVTLALGIWAWRGKWWNQFAAGLARGGWLDIAWMVAILVGVGLNFDWLFAQFHHLFFTGDSWLFFYSDTLIRLFPIRFWQDAFIFVGGFNLACGLALGLGLRHR